MSRDFPDKDELYLAVLEHTMNSMHDVVVRHLLHLSAAPAETWRSAMFVGKRAWLVDVFIDGLRAQRARY